MDFDYIPIGQRIYFIKGTNGLDKICYGTIDSIMKMDADTWLCNAYRVRDCYSEDGVKWAFTMYVLVPDAYLSLEDAKKAKMLKRIKQHD